MVHTGMIDPGANLLPTPAAPMGQVATSSMLPMPAAAAAAVEAPLVEVATSSIGFAGLFLAFINTNLKCEFNRKE